MLWSLESFQRRCLAINEHLYSVLACLQVPLVFNQFNNDTKQLKLVVVALGSKYGKSDGFAEPLAALTRSLLSRGIQVVLMTRPPINTAAPAPLSFNNYNTTTAMAINKAIRTVATETGASCLDTWDLIMATGDNWKVAYAHATCLHPTAALLAAAAT